MAGTLTAPELDQAAYMVALFSTLIYAWRTNDFHEAARTRDELAELGVKVTMARRRKKEATADGQ